MGPFVSVAPFRCRMWQLHDRLEESITDETCRAELASFAQHGQLVPVLGRPLTDDVDYDVELIYGARRLFVARQMNVPLLAEVRSMSDKEALIAMDLENRQRRDISPYERGLGYARWLRQGYFGSQEEIARFLSVSTSHVSRLLRMARLPSAVVGAFGNAADICEGWAVNLSEALEDPSGRKRILETARVLGTPPGAYCAKEVYRKLLAASAAGRKPRMSNRDKVIHDENGRPLFRIRYQQTSISLVLPVEKVSTQRLAEIQTAVAAILQPQRVQPRAYPAERPGPHPHIDPSR
jgi:ParB family chromosome partitioning protein